MTGKGVTGTVTGRRVAIGTAAFLRNDVGVSGQSLTQLDEKRPRFVVKGRRSCLSPSMSRLPAYLAWQIRSKPLLVTRCRSSRPKVFA